MTVLILKGLPGSGKTTYAKKLVSEGGWCRVNKDDLRAMLHNSKWSKANEKLVVAMRDLLIVEALSAGLNVVVDDTNFNPKHEADIRKLTESFEPGFAVKLIDTPLMVCIERDLKRSNSVGEKVIRQMYNQYLKFKPEPYHPTGILPRAILCDIDGTLAHMVNRSPYDYSKVGEDEIDEVVLNILYDNYNVDPMAYDTKFVILLSGRPDSARLQTEAWLAKHHVPYHYLHMRKTGDKRHDYIVKSELFDKHIRGNFEIKFVLDDRNQVVEMWRDMGLKVLQVAEGDF